MGGGTYIPKLVEGRLNINYTYMRYYARPVLLLTCCVKFETGLNGGPD